MCVIGGGGVICVIGGGGGMCVIVVCVMVMEVY